jgi:hypothetical protein
VLLVFAMNDPTIGEVLPTPPDRLGLMCMPEGLQVHLRFYYSS